MNICVRVGTKTLVKIRPWIGAGVSSVFTSPSGGGAMLLSMTSLTERRSWCDPQLDDLGRLAVSDSAEELLALCLSR